MYAQRHRSGRKFNKDQSTIHSSILLRYYCIASVSYFLFVALKNKAWKMWDGLCNRWCFIVSAMELVAAYNDHGKQMKQWALNDEAKGLCFTVGQTRNKRKNFEGGYWPSQPVCQVHEQGSTQLGRFGHVVAFCYCTGSRELGNCTLPCATRVRWIICKFMNAQQNLLVYCQPFLHKRCCVILLLYPC